MTIDTTAPRTRRALLAGALGGIGAWAASAISRTSPVLADGEVIHVGDDIETAAATTWIANTANDETVLQLANDHGGIAL